MLNASIRDFRQNGHFAVSFSSPWPVWALRFQIWSPIVVQSQKVNLFIPITTLLSQRTRKHYYRCLKPCIRHGARAKLEFWMPYLKFNLISFHIMCFSSSYVKRSRRSSTPTQKWSKVLFLYGSRRNAKTQPLGKFFLQTPPSGIITKFCLSSPRRFEWYAACHNLPWLSKIGTSWTVFRHCVRAGRPNFVFDVRFLPKIQIRYPSCPYCNKFGQVSPFTRFVDVMPG